jgi:tRNA A-37 threonylcarbamoyl transferase component Bud32
MSVTPVANQTEPPKPRPSPVAVVRRRRRPSGEPPPLPRSLQRSGVVWLIIAAVALVIWVLTALNTPLRVIADTGDRAILDVVVALRTDVMTDVTRAVHALGSNWAARILRWGVIIVLLVFRRWRHLFAFLGALVLVETFGGIMAEGMRRARPPVEILGNWEGFSNPSIPIAGLAATVIGVAFTLCVVGKPRRIALWAGGAMIIGLGAARVYLAVDHPGDVLYGAVLGIAVPLIVFRAFVPESVFPVAYRRGRTAHLAIDQRRLDAITAALEDQLGVVLRAIKPVGLTNSAGSTPLRITVAGETGPTYLFAKLYAANHLRSDRSYKLWRALRYGRLEDEAPFESVRRLVQYEDYLLRVFRDAGLPVSKPYGFVELTPEREYLLVTEFMDGAQESSEVECSIALIDDAMAVMRRMWDAGLAHRDIKPANVMVRDNKVVLIDVAFGQVRPTPWREAVDLANMMLILAMRSDAATVYDRAVKVFTPREIAEAFAATSEATRPSLRKMMRADGRDLLVEFRRLAPPHPKIKIQRWSARRVLLTLRVVAVGLIVFAFTVSQLQAAGLL